uniref:Uncharacterized protein n=1 Tax=Picea glauca TaxID=3330 RepID=A0A101LZF5_PICGL|nr:hypothetical protein ABT39_MTgene5188 [Picea glauca]QHR91166.1 hypothetical protein Q903MT_gene5198 [Picea sitchensis]
MNLRVGLDLELRVIPVELDQSNRLEPFPLLVLLQMMDQLNLELALHLHPDL